MFGGLEIKGLTPGTKAEKQPDVPAGSSFSFISGPSMAAESAPATAPTSAFSFMTATTMATGSVPSELPSAETVASGTSAFNFMSDPEIPSPAAAAAAVTASSGFSFVSNTTTQSSAVDIPSSFIRNTSDEGPGIAGAGVTFGGAAAQRKNIKRRSRAPKVGAAGSTMPMYGSTGGDEYQYGDSGGDMPVMTKDAAEDAVRRADEFLQRKQEEQSRLVSVAPGEPSSDVAMTNPVSIYSPDIDDELVEAQRAAEEAQARLAREATKETPSPAQKSAFSWFGGLRNKGSNDNSERSVSNGGVMAEMTARSSDSSLMIPTPDPSQHSGLETQAERILREQEEIKKAMAERHLKLAKKEDYDINPAKTVWDRPPVMEATPSWSKPASELAAGIPPTIPSWGVKAPAPPPPSPRQLMDIILQQFASDVQRSMQKVGELRQQRNMLLEERFVALAKERLAVQQIIQTETQQMDAAEREDFELADRLQVILEGHNREKAECTAILDNISKALTQLDEQTPLIVSGVTKCFENVASDLEGFKAKQKNAADPSDAMARFALSAKQLSDENERLRTEEKAVEREEELVKMERMELDAAIAEQTSELERLRDESKEKLTDVEREIEDLREQLRLKEIESQQLKMQMLAQDADISKVLVKFNRQISRVQKKEMSVRENHREWTNESSAYLRLKEAHDAEVTAHSEALLQRNTIMDEIKDNISVASTFQDIISQAVTFEHIREEDEEVDGNLAQIQADVVKCEAAVTEAAQLAKAAEACLVSLDSESRRLQEKLPKLEEEKSKAAAKRDFKTAGRASKEIKEFTARLHELEETLISAAKERHSEAKVSLERVQNDLERELVTANQKEKESGRVSMEKIANRIKALVDTKNKVCGKASAYTVKGVGALVLQSQIDALKLEGQSLGHKFGGWENVFDGLEESEEVDNDDEEDKPSADDSNDMKEEVNAVGGNRPPRPCDEVIHENVEKAKELHKKLAQIEVDLDSAAEQEDFERAAELDEILQDIKDTLEKLDLTDAEADLVMSGGNTQTDSVDVGNEAKLVTPSEQETEEIIEGPPDENEDGMNGSESEAANVDVVEPTPNGTGEEENDKDIVKSDEEQAEKC